MRVKVSELPTFNQPVVGNVYAYRGGNGTKFQHSMVLIAITEKGAGLLLAIDREGNPVGVTSYGIHVLEERAPIAFVDGLEDLDLTMRSL